MQAASAQPDFVADLLRVIIAAIELLGVAVIVMAAIVATLSYLASGVRDGAWGPNFQSYRSTLGRGILLGLEFLIAADIIRTVTLSPTLNSLLVLGGIVVVRTFLSLSLQVEIEGRWPWQPKGPGG
ncbi:MAG TPA: DUF1622 domain-containing protein [Bauldia sp.]|nr:DUF1622 domain-containing protein [Bauldia sp.]